MDERRLERGRLCLLRQHGCTVSAELELERPLALNDIARVTVSASRPIAFDSYSAHRETGSFILIDPSTGATSGAGMIAEPLWSPTARAERNELAARIVSVARAARSSADAVAAVIEALDSILMSSRRAENKTD